MAKLFSWLHLSDIHFQPKSETFNDVRIRKSLPEYLKNLNLQCNAIFITGDFRYAPKKEETSAEDVCNYIRTISSALCIGDDKIYIVPGNHDLERSTARGYFREGVLKDYKTNVGFIDSDVMASLSKDFVFYSSIQNTFKQGLKLGKDNPHSIIDIGPCYLLMMNTSLVAGSDNDSNHLIVGIKYLSNLLDNESINKPVICIGHHGFDMLEHNEKNQISKYLVEKGARLYLCGHTHENWQTPFYDNGEQINVGCMSQGTEDVKAGFSIGSLCDNGDVMIEMYMWDKSTKSWNKDEANSKNYEKLYEGYIGKAIDAITETCDVEQPNFPFKLKGYHLIGGLGCDGIKYVWEKDPGIIVESLAFNKRVRIDAKPEDEKISAYTISTSMGCQLSSFGKQCLFCQTGLNKYIPITAEDIALQCIFMAEYDSDCPSYTSVKDNYREFAFMGQGEPGMNYTQVKRAIQLSDIAMKMIGQKVVRYVISTSGITDFMPDLINDWKKSVFLNRVTVHFSLNAIDGERDKLMPINKMYNYKDFIGQCCNLYEITEEKIGVGILLMVDYKTKDGIYISLDAGKLKAMLAILDPKVFKIDFCTVNKTQQGGQRQLSNEEANKYLDIAKGMGFECKLFASFGEGEEVGCGMLTSSLNDLNKPGKTTMGHYAKAVELLMKAKAELDKNS